MMYKELQEMQQINALINENIINKFESKSKEDLRRLVIEGRYEEAVFTVTTKLKSEIKFHDLFYIMNDLGFSRDIKSRYNSYVFKYEDDEEFEVLVNGFRDNVNSKFMDIKVSRATEEDIDYVN